MSCLTRTRAFRFLVIYLYVFGLSLIVLPYTAATAILIQKTDGGVLLHSAALFQTGRILRHICGACASVKKGWSFIFKKNHKNRHMLYNWTNTTTHLTTYSTRMWYVGIEMSEFMHLTIKSLRWQAIQMRINSCLQVYTVNSVGIFIICWFERSRRNTFILVLVRELFYLFPPSTITIVDVVSAGTTNQNNTNKSKVLNLLTWMSVLM